MTTGSDVPAPGRPAWPERRNRYIRFNVNLLPGPLSDAAGGHPFVDIDRYVASARLAEEGLFDSVFLADSLAVGGDAMFANWALDPLTILPAIARETTSIGLVATISTTYTTPYALARGVLSVDHISRGRAGWNIITTMEPRVARNFGLDAPPSRADRYRRAREFAEVVLALWQSWDDDLGEPWDVEHLSRRPIDHHGEFFAVAGPLQLPRSRQGLPVVYQAGGSDDGIDLAADFADAVFSVGVEESSAAAYRARLNHRARRTRGRDVQVLHGLSVTVGSTETEALELLARAEEEIEHNGQLRRFAARYGIDPDTVDLDAPVDPELLGTDQSVSIGFAQGGIDLARRHQLSLRRFLVLGGGGHRRVFGTPESIADDLVGWVERGAADGFNLAVASLPEFVEHLVPVLQDRGAYRRRYTGTTLRDHITQHDG